MTPVVYMDDRLLILAPVVILAWLLWFGWWLSRPPRPRRGGTFGDTWGRR